VLATATAPIDELISDSLKQVDEANLRRKYSEQDEFVIADEFLPQEVLGRWQVELETLKLHVHRNYLPGHKKGRQRCLRDRECASAVDHGCLSQRAVARIPS
jgi:hypothetical protein